MMETQRIAAMYRDRVCSAEKAARLITSGMTLGVSGFAQVGYPKAVPQAIAKQGTKDLTVIGAASCGDEVDGALTRSGAVRCRFPYQSNKSMRAEINAGHIGYADMHLSHLPMAISCQNHRMDVAIIECVAVTEEGIYPAASGGATNTLIRYADRVILEVNTSLPLSLMGMHDFFDPGVPPRGVVIPLSKPDQRIGKAFIPCQNEKIAAVVLSDGRDEPPVFKTPSAEHEQIAEHIVAFLEKEVQAGRLPETLGPIQSGVGGVANAVLYGLSRSHFKNLPMYTETLQDAALSLLDDGTFCNASTCCISLSAGKQAYFYQNIDNYRSRILIRNQDVTNHPEVIRRLGLISLNTPLEMDLYGNANSTHVAGSKVVNGIGGSGDFARNARLNFFAAASTAKNGSISSIVPLVSHVDHTEHDTQVFVTEQGIADLRWKTPLERAEAIIENCAHPSYRPALRAYLDRACRVSPGKHIPMDLSTAFSFHQKLIEQGDMRS